MTNDPTTPRARGDGDAPHISSVTPVDDLRTVLINNASWGAVLAGVFMALVTQLLLNMLGVGIGAATLNPGDAPSASGLTVGAALWLSVAGIIAAFVGGHTAGRLSGKPKESTAAWHGLTAWALSTLIVALLLTTALGGLLGGTLSAIGGVARTATQSAATATAAADPFQGIEVELRAGATGDDPATLRDAATASMRALVTGDPARAEESRQRAATVLARAQGISADEARARVAGYEQQYRQTVEQARQRALEAAETARRATARGALASFLALVLGALAAWFGGRLGTIDPTVTERTIFGRTPAASVR
jgi:hypothetical protein